MQFIDGTDINGAKSSSSLIYIKVYSFLLMTLSVSRTRHISAPIKAAATNKNDGIKLSR